MPAATKAAPARRQARRPATHHSGTPGGDGTPPQASAEAGGQRRSGRGRTEQWQGVGEKEECAGGRRRAPQAAHRAGAAGASETPRSPCGLLPMYFRLQHPWHPG